MPFRNYTCFHAKRIMGVRKNLNSLRGPCASYERRSRDAWPDS